MNKDALARDSVTQSSLKKFYLISVLFFTHFFCPCPYIPSEISIFLLILALPMHQKLIKN